MTLDSVKELITNVFAFETVFPHLYFTRKVSQRNCAKIRKKKIPVKLEYNVQQMPHQGNLMKFYTLHSLNVKILITNLL